MNNTLKAILNRFSIFTTDPSVDWRRVFIGLLILTIGGIVWNVSFYLKTKEGIIDIENQQTRSSSPIISQRETELRDLVNAYELRVVENKSIIEGTYTSSVTALSDPSLQY